MRIASGDRHFGNVTFFTDGCWRDTTGERALSSAIPQTYFLE